MVSLWWVAAAFFVGGCAGVVLVAVMSMTARQTGDACNLVGRWRERLQSDARLFGWRRVEIRNGNAHGKRREPRP